MKILAVGMALFGEMTGGSSRYLSGLVDALRDAGHEVVVLTGSGVLGTSHGRDRGMAGQIQRTARRLLLIHTRGAAEVLRMRPDVVNVHFALDGLGAVVAARLLRRPIVVIFHGPWAREALATRTRGGWPFSTLIRRYVERRVYRSAARCIVLSAAFRDVLAADYGVSPGRIRIVPGGIDVAVFEELIDRSAARIRLGIPDRPTIVSVRRLVPRMGLDLLISALAFVTEDRRPTLAIAGTGPEYEALERQAQELGVADRVCFMGRVADADLPALYAAGDVCVVPTRELEGFGYVALEAYAAGTPVIATAVGGLVDLVGAFDPDALVPVDQAAIAARIMAVLRARPMDRGRCRAYAATFDWSRIEPRVEAVFREAIAS